MSKQNQTLGPFARHPQSLAHLFGLSLPRFRGAVFRFRIFRMVAEVWVTILGVLIYVRYSRCVGGFGQRQVVWGRAATASQVSEGPRKDVGEGA
jgi:hypothetical protein